MITERPPGLKWNYFEPDVLPAWVAEMDFGLAPPIGAALHEAVERGDTGYLYPSAMESVAVAAVGFWRERFAWDVAADRVHHVPDVVEGMRRAIVHLTRPDSKVIVPTPAYFPFFSMIERAGRDRVDVRSIRGSDGRWGLDLEAINRAFADGAGSVILCNPWNPTGRSLNAGEVGALIEIAVSHGGRVLADEVHAALTYPGAEHVVAADINSETVVTVTAASKAWNIPGLKAAQVVLTSDKDLEVWSEYFTPEKIGVGTFGLFASAAAYAQGTSWLDEVMLTLDRNRNLLADLIAQLLPEATMSVPQATYLAWLDLSAYGWDDPASHLLAHARVGLSEGRDFGPGGEGYVRFNFATSEDLIAEVVGRMANVLTSPAG